MGDWDYYCALCAATFTLAGLNEFLESAVSDGNYSMELMSWCEKLRVVGQNPAASGLRRCYISGVGRHNSYGYALCAPGDDPNAPGVNAQDLDISCYYNYADEQEGAIPFHEKCFELFLKVLANERGGGASSNELDVDPDLLYGALCEKRTKRSLRCLDVDYFELDEYKGEQYFYFIPEIAPFLLDPIDVPALKGYRQNMPALQPSDTPASAPPPLRANQDPFSVLPPELLLAILVILPKASVIPVLIASPAIRRVQPSSSFWRSRVVLDMPWSWEVIEYAAKSKETFDWKKIYSDLHAFSKSPAKGNGLALGFANRRRIYNVCKPLVDVYLRLSEEARSAELTGDMAQMLETVKCHHFPAVSMPMVSSFTSSTKFMLSQWSDIASEKKTLEIAWNGDGVLSGLALTIRGSRSAVEARRTDSGSVDTLVLQENDWLDGFEFTISSAFHIVGLRVRTVRASHATFGSVDGDGVRLMAVESGYIFVGLKGVVANGAIARLGLLECPPPSTIDLPSLPKPDAYTRKLIWKKQVPPANIHALSFHTGYNNQGNEATESSRSMEALIFGTSESELDALTGVAVTEDFMGFYAYHSDKAPSYIGLSKDNLKHFTVDGAGGERIVKLSLYVGGAPIGLKILTNRGRQVIFGSLQAGHGQVYDYTGASILNETITGFYAAFEVLNGYRRFNALGALCHASTSPSIIPDAPGDWEPCAPPPTWRLAGPVYGLDAHFSLVYLDLTKPILKVTGMLAAPEWYDTIELGGFVVTYVDGTACYIGVPSTLWAGVHDVDAANKLPRHAGMSLSLGRSAAEGIAHATTEQAIQQNRDGDCWDLGPNGALISSVIVWAGKYLNGIQFHAVDGKSSPKWGKCGQTASARISTQSGSSDSDIPTQVGAVGVKIFLDAFRESYGAPSARPLGLQAFVVD